MKTDLVGKIGSLQNQQTHKQPEKGLGKGPSFEQALQEISKATKANIAPESAAPKTLKFSNHAVERMSQRGISFTPEQMTKIEEAAEKASAKGAKETLIFTDDHALIVSAKNKTIVTVMDKATMKDNVFTKIDATVVL